MSACPIHENLSSISHCCRVKKYPDGSTEILAASRPVFREKGWEPMEELPPKLHDSSGGDAAAANPGPTQTGQERAARRAAAKIRDLALCNRFRWFVTLTLDQTKIDRYDIKAITRKLNSWLDNQVRRKGLCYVLVPERHKDGAIHFHGFFNDIPGFVSSGTWKVPGRAKPVRPRSQRQATEWSAAGGEQGYHEVCNFEGWPYGFTTAIELYGDYHSAVAYVCKYVRKQTGEGGKIGGRWYYSGGALALPEVELCDIGPEELLTADPTAYSFNIEEAALSFCLVRTGPAGRA